MLRKGNLLITGLIFVAVSAFTVHVQDGLKETMERGQKVYNATCITCHQADGGGAPPMNPPIIQTKWILGDKKELIRIVLKGLKGGEIEIDGDSFHNPMPPLEKLLSDQQIADVLTYVRKSFGNNATGVTPAEVKSVRVALK